MHVCIDLCVHTWLLVLVELDFDCQSPKMGWYARGRCAQRSTPTDALLGVQRGVHVFGIQTTGGSNSQLAGSGKTYRFPPFNCMMNAWGAWGACSNTCGTTGTRTRARTVQHQPAGGGTACPALTEVGACNRVCWCVWVVDPVVLRPN